MGGRPESSWWDRGRWRGPHTTVSAHARWRRESRFQSRGWVQPGSLLSSHLLAPFASSLDCSTVRVVAVGRRAWAGVAAGVIFFAAAVLLLLPTNGSFAYIE